MDCIIYEEVGGTWSLLYDLETPEFKVINGTSKEEVIEKAIGVVPCNFENDSVEIEELPPDEQEWFGVKRTYTYPLK